MALFVILLWRPAMLFDVGLQLSFAAVAGRYFYYWFLAEIIAAC
jgi:predicted membrane metal-binding protein